MYVRRLVCSVISIKLIRIVICLYTYMYIQVMFDGMGGGILWGRETYIVPCVVSFVQKDILVHMYVTQGIEYA